jgi:hypothetical protein
MGRLKNRLDTLAKKSDYQLTTLVCPECSQEFTAYGDVALEVIIHQWSSQVPEHVVDGSRETPQDVLRLLDHEHDVSTFLEKSSGLPFLSREVSGFNLREPPDRSKDAT